MIKNKTLKLALIPFSVMSILTGCGTDKVRLPEVKSFEYYDCVDYYGWNSETQAVEIFAEGDEGSYVNLFNGEIITFEDVEFYVADTMNYLADNSDAVRFSTEKNVENKTVIITNETTKATLTLNYKKQKITYSDYSAFLNYSIEALCPSDVISRELKNNRFIDTKLVKSKPGKSITIDLNKYDIPMYWHEDKCYLPTAFVGNFFYGVSLSLGITTAFDGKDMYLTNYEYSDEYIKEISGNDMKVNLLLDESGIIPSPIEVVKESLNVLNGNKSLTESFYTESSSIEEAELSFKDVNGLGSEGLVVSNKDDGEKINKDITGTVLYEIPRENIILTRIS